MKRILAVLLIAALAYGGYLLSRQRSYTAEEMGIQTYTSSVDADGDGIDDQTDILENAKAYVEGRPKYKSKYYGTGYPDDEYGTCVDVVGYALRNAGYDLMNLVSEDIAENPDDYDIEYPDANIDFRRTPNLDVYFRHTAISLTTDVTKTEEWMPGDIVMFSGHIGIISDRYNSKGIPFVIHHSNPAQIFYIEDILEKRNDIIGHYRIS